MIVTFTRGLQWPDAPDDSDECQNFGDYGTVPAMSPPVKNVRFVDP